MSNLSTSIIIEVINRATEPVRKISKSFTDLNRAASPALSDIGKKFSAVTSELTALTGKFALLGAAGVWAFKRQFIDTASQFEQFTAVLETVERSSAKAQESMRWVSDFAAVTPYELGDVTDAFVKLRAYGLDPTKGLLKSIGDVAAGGNKSMIQGVEAIADAVMGSFERLKEFSSTTAVVKGDKVRFGYLDASGKQQYKIVDKHNRAMIASTLQAIWNEQYEGAMEKQSRTWRGMIGNLTDQWTRFKVSVMQAGLFDWMKGKLSALLDTVNRLAASGSMQRWAQLWSDKITDGMKKAYAVGEQLWGGFKRIASAVDSVANSLGGYDRLLIAVGVTMATDTIFKIVSLTDSLIKLGRVVLPMVGAAFTTMAEAAVAALGSIGAALAPLAVLLAPFVPLLGFIAGKESAEAIGKKVSESHVKGYSTETLQKMLTDHNAIRDPQGYQSRLIEAELERRQAENDRMVNQAIDRAIERKISAELKVTLDHQNQQLRVTHLSSNGMDVDVDTGRLMPAH